MALRRFGADSSLARLRWGLAVFFVALAAPSLLLIRHAFVQVEADSIGRHRQMAEDALARIDGRLADALGAEEARGFDDYGFLIAPDDPAGAPQRSALSSLPVASAVPGAISYFQVDAGGRLTTPLLPGDGTEPGVYRIADTERAEREALELRVRDTLARTELIRPLAVPAAAGAGAADTAERAAAPAAVTADLDAVDRRQAATAGAGAAATAAERAPPAEGAVVDQALFDRITVEQMQAGVSDVAPLVAAGGARAPQFAPAAERVVRTAARSASPSPPGAGDRAGVEARLESAVRAEPARIALFASEIEPFQFGRLSTGHFVMFRYAWRGGQRYVQGLLLDANAFVAEAIGSAFAATPIAEVAELDVRYRGEPLPVPAAAAGVASGAVFYRGRLSPPFASIELELGAAALPPGAGYSLLVWSAALLSVVLVAGFAFMYRYGVHQIRLVRQQQEFVSAVSHELKTPLTSIRMYGEMLKSGWADEDKKRSYYEFIHDESERLSRLIENVLQLARMTRNTMTLALERVTVGRLMDLTRSKVATQIERAGFALELDCGPDTDGLCVRVDQDGFAQIMINLVDNAVKFSKGADSRVVRVGARRNADKVVFTVRDFGPGVPRSQMRRLFELFYRPDNETTRAAGGTGIGLALVKRLAAAMSADVDVVNREPGAEFRVSFPLAGTAEP